MVCFAVGPLIIAYFAISFLVLLVPASSSVFSGVWIYRLDSAAIGITVGIMLIITGLLRRQWSQDASPGRDDVEAAGNDVSSKDV